MADDMEEEMTQLINQYMESSVAFGADLETLSDGLAANAGQWVFGFAHVVDITSLNTSNNDNLDDYLAQNADTFGDIFRKRLIRRIGKQVLNDRNIWSCLKFKNLSQQYHHKKYKHVKRSESKLVTIDFLQVVSMSAPTKTLIATKLVAIDENQCDAPFKWKVRPLADTNRGYVNKSQKYRESSDDRIHAKKRKMAAIFGTDYTKDGMKNIEITVNYMAFTQKELDYLYIGSHLQMVVLLKSRPKEYILLSFDKKFCRRPAVHQSVPLSGEFDQFLNQFPQQIQLLFNDRLQSNYSFMLSLAFIFGENVSLLGSFFRLKLGLLLNVLSLNDFPKRNNSSVLVVCNDTTMTRRLLHWSALFADHHFIQTSISQLMSGGTRMTGGVEWTDSGALHLGADGVTVITGAVGLNDLPVKNRTALFHALESNEVIARNNQSPLDNQTLKEVELKTTIWAVSEDIVEERELKPKGRSMFGGQQIRWSEVFGMVYVIKDPTDRYFYQPSGDYTFDMDEWRQTLELMAHIRPQLSVEVEELLHDYFMSNRRIRGSVMKRLSMETLVCLAKGSARLSLRLTVTKHDALMAILLYEESLKARFPHFLSSLAIEPVFHVRSEDMADAIGPNCDHFMADFERKLNQFIDETKPKSEASGSSGSAFQQFILNEE
ncbi:unnamed protein product [Medioppia subpectinata]|uniref:Uncharacterized protein n=1 Tax=Medioppia subpectinata TaxID=1979941 RepID=A0A7R9KG13_9ACAR|nr:unnamed protein product [Medioppia subpectinata]CAG2102714.1 unnamed protein product [Medioppia subpectinata]